MLESTKHNEFLDGDFWRRVPGYADIDVKTFLDWKWQAKNSVTNLARLHAAVGGVVSDEFMRDVELGLEKAPMSVRISPYTMALIDWSRPEHDPIRTQFLPLASRMLPDHPMLSLDSLNEQGDSPVSGLTHRYPDKVLFLALDTCPVYCRFCTRSYAVGLDTDTVEKVSLRVSNDRWSVAFKYIADNPQVEDVVISGGDAYNLKAGQVRQIGQALLDIPNVRRIRYATKGPAIMPQKLLTDDDWFRELVWVVEYGRKLGKDVALHTHFNHPREATDISRQAMGRLHSEGVTVRNQAVLIRDVNDDVDTMVRFVRRLGYINVHSYYVYMHDLVRGAEDMRTTLQAALDLEKSVRGATAGFNTPMFIVDAPGGGGKRDVHSFERYNRMCGISVYRSPNVDPDRSYCYFDPVDLLENEEAREMWQQPGQYSHERAVQEAIVGGLPELKRYGGFVPSDASGCTALALYRSV